MWNKFLILLYSVFIISIGLAMIVLVFKTIDNKGWYRFALFKTDFVIITGCLLMLAAIIYFIISI